MNGLEKCREREKQKEKEKEEGYTIGIRIDKSLLFCKMMSTRLTSERVLCITRFFDTVPSIFYFRRDYF